jgi:DNA mismatch repair protein MutL
MPRISLLPEELTNQIAAGEVVERPASVVKELVENSLDAGAQRIDVDIEEGGLKLVRIADDGSGMSPEDAELSLLRHATSKLRSADDLFRLQTMGFRGEALASVASVSRLQLTTRSKEAVAAYRVAMEAGHKHSPSREVGGPVGTQVEIRDLFYNVPARLKFMKTEATETGHIAETLVRLSLAYPGVHFRLRAGESGRQLLDLPPHRSALERSQAALASRGKGQGAPPLYLGQGSVPGVSVEVHLGSPDDATTTARNVFLLCNRRFVRDRSLLQAVTTGYGELLERGRYPLCVLHLALDLQLVDVNVHPQKLEVRIANADAVFSAVQRAIREVCVAAPWLLGARSVASRPAASERTYVLGSGLVAAAEDSRPSYGSAPRPGPGPAHSPLAAVAAAPQLARRAEVATHAAPPLQLVPRPSGLHEHRSRLQQALKLYAPIASPADDEQREHPREVLRPPEHLADDAATPRLVLGQLPYLGQLFATYLLCEYQSELLIVDQHAAHERVLFERLRRAFGQTPLASQRLLFPVHLTLDEPRAALLSEYDAAIEQLGFEVRLFSGTTFALTAAPDLGQYGRGAMVQGEPERLLRLVLEELEEHGRSDALHKRDELLLATMACHAATRAGDVLDESRARALLTALDDVALSPYCPHGRPVLWRLDKSEIERRFHRT